MEKKKSQIGEHLFMAFMQGPEMERDKELGSPQGALGREPGDLREVCPARTSRASGKSVIALFQQYKMLYLQTQLNHLNQGSFRNFIKKLIIKF